MLSQFSMAQENKVSKALKKYNNDTTKYIQEEILDFKHSYVGKPLDSLLKDLPTILYYGNDDVPRNKSLFTTTILYFSSYKTTMEKMADKKFPMVLTIRWMTPLDNTELNSLGSKPGDEWTQSVYNYFKNKIVGKIESINYYP